MRVHEAALGFEIAAEEYEKGRPEYPPDAIRALTKALKLRRKKVVVDLAAGTGKLTRALLPTGATIVAVEPAAGMRRVFARELPMVSVLDGTAESIPLRERSADAVVVGQAFHWFDARRALEEISRVLKPKGGLGLVWNLRDESVPWVARVTQLLDQYDPGVPRTREGAWKAAFSDFPSFTPLSERTFAFRQIATIDTVVARFTSVSFVAVLPAERRNEIARAVRDILARDSTTRGRPSIEVPYRTELYWSTRV